MKGGTGAPGCSKACPDPDTKEWARLTKWEQRFLTDLRRQAAEGVALTAAQYASLEQVYEKSN